MNINPALYLKGRQIQNSSMFLVMIPIIPQLAYTLIPYATYGSDFMFMVRSTSIPQKKSEIKIVKTYNGRFTVPQRTEMEHEWSCKLLMTEDSKVFDSIVKWYNLTQAVSDLYYSDAFIVMLDYNYNATKAFQLKNIYPIEVPAITDLNQDSIDEMIDFEVKFSFDDVYYNEDHLLDWVFKLINPETIMNIAKATNK